MNLQLEDPAYPRDSVEPAVSLDTLRSGVEAIRVWFGPGEPDGVTWQPATDSLALRLPDGEGALVRVQARDVAGNLSAIANMVFSKPLLTPLDRAIAAEQRAEDLLDLGRWQDARLEVVGSLPWIEEAFTASVVRLSKSKGKNSDEKHMLTTLAKVRAKKFAALALMKPQTLPKGRALLEAALALEIELATFAHTRGLTL